MTVKIGTWNNGDVLDATDLNDTIVYVNTVWDVKFIREVNFTGIIAHSSTVYSLIQSGGTIVLWNGTTWSIKNSDFDSIGFIKICKDDATKGFAIEGETGTPKSAYTADSGTTWTTKTSLAIDTEIYDVSFPTANLIVVGGSDGGTDYIERSTDQGANWSAASTSPSAIVHCLDMYDGSNGLAIDSTGAIWKTTDAGDNWVDTTHTIAETATLMNICCLSGTTAIVVCNGYIFYYDGTQNAIAKYYNPASNRQSNIIYTNGYYYVQFGNSVAYTGFLVISSDGQNWTTTMPLNYTSTFAQEEYSCCFVPYDTGKIMYVYGGLITKLDRSAL